MTDVERDNAIRTLFSMRVQIDGLLATLQAPTAAPAAKAQVDDGFPKPAACKHPPARRDQISAFGNGPNKFWCMDCQQTITEGA